MILTLARFQSLDITMNADVKLQSISKVPSTEVEANVMLQRHVSYHHGHGC